MEGDSRGGALPTPEHLHPRLLTRVNRMLECELQAGLNLPLAGGRLLCQNTSFNAN